MVAVAFCRSVLHDFIVNTQKFTSNNNGNRHNNRLYVLLFLRCKFEIGKGKKQKTPKTTKRQENTKHIRKQPLNVCNYLPTLPPDTLSTIFSCYLDHFCKIPLLLTAISSQKCCRLLLFFTSSTVLAVFPLFF